MTAHSKTESESFDPTNQLISYLENLTVTQGPRAGELFKVLPWERRFVKGAFRAGIKTAALSIARGGGKSSIVAGIAAAALNGPLRVPRGETICVAASFEQGRIIFDHVRHFLEASGEHLANRKLWRVQDSANRAKIEHVPTGAVLRCIGSDPKKAHGLAPQTVIADEPAQWAPGTSDQMVAALLTSAGKMRDARFIALGTRPRSREHWFSKLLDGVGEYAQTHQAAPDDKPFTARTWRKANPSLDHMPDLKIAIEAEAKIAKRDPAMLPQFRAYRLNQGTDDVAAQNLIAASTWEQAEGDARANVKSGVQALNQAATDCRLLTRFRL